MYHIEKYQDVAKLYRWRLRAPNGRIMADGSEGYLTNSNLGRAVTRMVKVLTSKCKVKVVTVKNNIVVSPPEQGESPETV